MQFIVKTEDNRGKISNSFPCSLEYANELKEKKIEILRQRGYSYDLSSGKWYNPRSPIEYSIHLVQT